MELKERLKIFKDYGWTYDEITGVVLSHKGKIPCIKKASDNRKRLCRRCSIKYGKTTISVYAHQIAWYITYNEVPTIIDHINGDALDNRIVNLRLVTNQENSWNKYNNNYSKPIKGYYWSKQMKKWCAQIGLNNKNINLGYFNLEDEHLARQAYLDAKKIYHII